MLWAISAGTGEKLSAHRLDYFPIFHGLSDAGGRLYMSLRDGRVGY